ncbi:MAG: CheB methylesterase domain-containing protein [Planctomycetota bacterium]|nr:CheB methylesterase domain-containing protein [Planctomycetota bacterium]
MICIGSSTGGPPVLETILAALPENLSTPMVIAQHMPGVFTASMAKRLAQMCNLPVHHAADQMPLQRRAVCVAEGGKQIHIKRLGPARWELLINDDPPDAPYRPCVDVLFRSAAEAIGPCVPSIVLTGMGNDGLEGGRVLPDAGAVLLARNEESCVVYGMPKAVTEQALTAASLPLDQIAQSIRSLTGDARASSVHSLSPPASTSNPRSR